MTSLVALCTDEASMRHPELIGLEGEELASQAWLRLFSSGEETRAFLRNDRLVDEVWVVSCDDVEPINLAATLKRDRKEMRVCLVMFQGTGSLRSRASAASIDATLTRQAFATRYAAFKRVRATQLPVFHAARDREELPGDLPLPFLPEEAPDQAKEPLAQGRTGASFEQKLRNAASDRGKARDDDSNCASAQTAASPASEHSEDVPQTITVQMTGEASRQALLLPVVSGSGGAGKSAVAALAATIAQRRGLKTLLLDFDLQFGDMREVMGQPEALGIDEVLDDPARLAQLTPSLGMPAVLGAPRHLEESEALARRAPALLDALRGMFDVIVANTGAAWAEHHAVLLERCSKALFLVDQRVSSLRACKKALDLCARCGIAVSPFMFAVNFCAKGAPFTSIDVSCALRGSEVVEFADGGAEVEELLSESRPSDLVEGGNPLALSIEEFLQSVLPATEEVPQEQLAAQSVFGLLFKRRRRRRRGFA